MVKWKVTFYNFFNASFYSIGMLKIRNFPFHVSSNFQKIRFYSSQNASSQNCFIHWRVSPWILENPPHPILKIEKFFRPEKSVYDFLRNSKTLNKIQEIVYQISTNFFHFFFLSLNHHWWVTRQKCSVRAPMLCFLKISFLLAPTYLVG